MRDMQPNIVQNERNKKKKKRKKERIGRMTVRKNESETYTLTVKAHFAINSNLALENFEQLIRSDSVWT